MLCGLAERLGLDHPGFRMTAREMIDATLKASGLPPADDFDDQPFIDCVLDDDEMHFRNGFGHPDRKFRFKPDWKAMGPAYATLPDLPGYFDGIDLATDEHPFRMVAAPARHYLNTSFTETPTSQKLEGRPTVKIHPDDLVALGIEAGDAVRVGNRLGDVKLHAEAFEGIQRGVIVVESVWPNASFEEGMGINVLISADPGLPAGGAVFHDTAVWIKAA